MVPCPDTSVVTEHLAMFRGEVLHHPLLPIRRHAPAEVLQDDRDAHVPPSTVRAK
jgi:hypothetical protein